jgi:uncharacterized protein YndB with AHSA1/START domain
MQPSDFKVPPVIKTVTYAGSPEDAFDRFAVEIGKWWPMETHSLGKAVDASSISFECLEAGGALVERCKSGDFHVWGSIVDIRHPRPISFTWHVGRPQDTAQLIEVTFDPKENGTGCGIMRPNSSALEPFCPGCWRVVADG